MSTDDRLKYARSIAVWVLVVAIGFAVILHASVTSIGFVYDGI